MAVVYLFKSFDDVAQLRRKDEIIRTVPLTKEEKQHEGLQFFPIFLSHVGHDIEESLVLSSDGLVLLHEHLHHRLHFLMLRPQQGHFLLKPFLSIGQGDHILLILVLLPGGLALDEGQKGTA
jgi:hypothetical protein